MLSHRYADYANKAVDPFFGIENEETKHCDLEILNIQENSSSSSEDSPPSSMQSSMELQASLIHDAEDVPYQNLAVCLIPDENQFKNVLVKHLLSLTELISQACPKNLIDRVSDHLLEFDAYSLELIKNCLLSCLINLQIKSADESGNFIPAIKLLNTSIQILDNSSLKRMQKVQKLMRRLQREGEDSPSLGLILTQKEGEAAVRQILRMGELSHWIDDMTQFIAEKILGINLENGPISSSKYLTSVSANIKLGKNAVLISPNKDMNRSIMMHGVLYPSSIFINDNDIVPLFSSQPAEQKNPEQFIRLLVETIETVKGHSTEQLAAQLDEYFAIPLGKINDVEKRLLQNEDLKRERKAFSSSLKGTKKEKKAQLDEFKLKQIIQIRLEYIYLKCPTLMLIPFFTVNFFNPAADCNRMIFSKFYPNPDGTHNSLYRMQADGNYGTHYAVEANEETKNIQFTITKKFFITELNDEGTRPELVSHLLNWHIQVPHASQNRIEGSVKLSDMQYAENITLEQAQNINWLFFQCAQIRKSEIKKSLLTQ